MLKVLIVDDDDIVIFIQKKIVQNCGLSKEPLSFKDGQSALNFITSNINPSDNYLILLDINMPKMNGWEFLNSLKDLDYQSQVYVVMVTSSIDQRDKQKAAEFNNVIDFIEKPVTALNCNNIKSHQRLARFFNQN